MENQTGILRIRMSMNLREHGLQVIILEYLEKNGTKEEVETARSWLNQPGTTLPKCTNVEAMFEDAEDVSRCRMIIKELGGLNIPLFPIINNLATRFDEDEKQVVAQSYLTELLDEVSYKDKLTVFYKQLTESKRETIQKLRYFANEISRVTKNVSISKVVGTSATVAGSTTSLLANLFAPSGVANVCNGVGNVVTTSGKLTVIGSDIIGKILTGKAENNAKELLRRQQVNTKFFIKELDIYKERIKSYFVKASLFGEVVLKFKQLNDEEVKVDIGVGDVMEKEFGYMQTPMKEMKTTTGKEKYVMGVVGGANFYNKPNKDMGLGTKVKTAATLTADLISATAHVIGKGTKIADTVAGSVFIVIDIVKIIKTAVDISKGSPNMASTLIRETAYKLERQELPKLNKLIITANIEAARECRLREEYFWPVSRNTFDT